MAKSQADDFCFFLLLLFSLDVVSGCSSSSKELHICLNIYLERDFPIIETILKGQQTPGYGNGRVLLEGPELDSICRNIRSLLQCYESLAIECNLYWQLNRYQQLMWSMRAMSSFLCGQNRTTNVRDILMNGACVRSAESHVGRCAEKFGINWAHSWKEMLRLQVEPNDRCSAIQAYKTCFDEEMKMVSCGRAARVIYGKLINVWLETWCNYKFKFWIVALKFKNSTINFVNSAFKLKASATLYFLLVVMYLFIKHSLLCDLEYL